MWWIVAVVAAVVLIATYVTWIAARLDRLHARAAAAHAALDAQLVRRAAAAAQLADTLGRGELRQVPVAEPLNGVVEASRRVALTRQVHNDSVRDALAVRRRPLVRLLRLSRRHPAPKYFDVDDPMLDPAAPAA